MNPVNSSVGKISSKFAHRLADYAKKQSLARDLNFQVHVHSIPVFKTQEAAREKIVYEPLPTYVTPRDWTPLFTRVARYEMYCTETPDYSRVTNVTYAAESTPRYKARLDVDVKSIKITPAEREVLRKLVGPRYNAKKDRISFVIRDLPTMMANENRCCQLLEVSIAKAQHLVWRMTHGDPTKTTFLAEEQLPNTPKAKKLIGTMEKLAIKGIQSHLDRVVLDCKYAYGSKADSAELQKQEIKNRFNSTFSKQIAALDLDTTN